MLGTRLSTWITRTDRAWHLAAQTGSDVALTANLLQRQYHVSLLSKKALRDMLRHFCFDVLVKVDPRLYFFGIDGDRLGRLRSELDHDDRRQLRGLVEDRRQRVTRVLRDLGDTAKEVDRTIMRFYQDCEWQDEDPIDVYVMAHLSAEDRCDWIYIGNWASSFGGVWVSTPAPVRHYLRCCSALGRPA